MDLSQLSEEQLLQQRICDLPLSIEGTWLEECVRQLYKELEEKGIIYNPPCYLAEEWLTPENEAVIGIPFYLADPVLTRLEKKMMLEAEGETRDWCMKLLRHEAGHALTYAYHLNRKRAWQKVFGSPQEEYGDTYRFRPYSKSYVRHLDGFYAQYHPDEDFVETFAVWLTPGLDWNAKYQGWKAHKKLLFVDDLMESIKGKPPFKSGGKRLWHYRTMRSRLGSFYKRRRRVRAEDFPEFHDGSLKRIFKVLEGAEGKPAPAAEIIKKYRKPVVSEVSYWTGEKKYIIADLLKTISKRCRALRLKTSEPEAFAVMKLTAYMNTLVMNYVHTGWYRGSQKDL